MLRLQTPWVVQLLWQLSPVFAGWMTQLIQILTGAGFLPGDNLLQRNQCCSGDAGSHCPWSSLPVQAETGTCPNPALSALSHVRAVNMDNSTVSFGRPLLGDVRAQVILLLQLRLFLTCFSVLKRLLSLCLCDAEELTHKGFFLAVMCWSSVRNS